MHTTASKVTPAATADIETDAEAQVVAAARSIFRWLTDTARDNPKKAIGAGAAVLAGAALAASVPFIAPAKPKAKTTKRKAPAKKAAKGASARARGNGSAASANGAGKPKARKTASRSRATGARKRSSAATGARAH